MNYMERKEKNFFCCFPDSKFDESRYIDDLLKTVSFDNYKIAPSSENLRRILKNLYIIMKSQFLIYLILMISC